MSYQATALPKIVAKSTINILIHPLSIRLATLTVARVGAPVLNPGAAIILCIEWVFLRCINVKADEANA